MNWTEKKQHNMKVAANFPQMLHEEQFVKLSDSCLSVPRLS